MDYAFKKKKYISNYGRVVGTIGCILYKHEKLRRFFLRYRHKYRRISCSWFRPFFKRKAQEGFDAVESQIKNRFNELASSAMFPAELDESNPQLLEVLGWLGDVKNKKILDAGCAKGRFSKALVKMGAKITGIDLAEEFISIAKENVPSSEFQVASITDIPFEDNTFDGVFCLEVLEHIPDTEKAISEMIRVLRPGGKIIIIDKNILSLDSKYLFIPTYIYKIIQECRNKWMYPKDFPFREKYFTLPGINKMLKKYYSTVNSTYLPNARSKRASRIYRLFPFLSFDIAWRAVK